MTPSALKLLFSEEDIEAKVRELAGNIDSLYSGEPLVMICVLKGAFMFFSDLVRRISIRPEIDFVRVASYGDNTVSSGNVYLTKDAEISLEGKHVLLVDDVVDSGLTTNFLLRMMATRGAKSLRLAALIDKKERREAEVTVDFAGFTLSSGFIVGYGLDYAEQFRTLPAIYQAAFENCAASVVTPETK
jgi:hypoxanthine phosphoribosyltransferase